MMKLKIILILAIVFASNVKTNGQNDFSLNRVKKLDNILLEGNLVEIKNYFKTQDSLFAINSALYDSEKIKEYNRDRNKYMALVRKIELITSKPQKEIKESYSYFVPNQLKYEKKLISKNSIKAFQKFKHYYNEENYYEAAKFINITFFFNFEKKSSSLKYFSGTTLDFSEEISNYESSIDCGDLEYAIELEARLDSLYRLLPDSATTNKSKYLLLKEQLSKQKTLEDNLLCSIKDVYDDPSFSINLGALLSYSHEINVPLYVVDSDNNKIYSNFFYNIPQSIGFGFSLSLDYKIINSLAIGVELGYFKYHYKYIGVFKGYDIDNIVNHIGPDIYGYNDLTLIGKFYNIYLQYKFVNRTIFHPFIRLAYGSVKTNQSFSSNSLIAPIFYNQINNYNESHDEFKYGVGVEILEYITDKLTISLLYSNKVAFSDTELSKINSGTFEIFLGYYW